MRTAIGLRYDPKRYWGFVIKYVEHIGFEQSNRPCRVFVNVEVDFCDQENFLFAYIHDASLTGIFVRTTTPEAPGTHLNIRFTPLGAESPIELDGQVVWVNPYRPDDNDNLSPGMGVRFLDLTTEQRLQLIELVKRIAYLSEDTERCEPAEPTHSPQPIGQ